jgi:hypothetical protein
MVGASKKRWYRWTKRALAVASTGFLVVFVVEGWNGAGEFLLANPTPVIGAVGLQVAASMFLSHCWVSALPVSAVGPEIRHLFLIVQPAKYLPGGIAQPVAQVSSAAELGIPGRQALGGYGLFVAMQVSAAVVLSVSLLGFGRATHGAGLALGIAAAGYLLALLVRQTRRALGLVLIQIVTRIVSVDAGQLAHRSRVASHTWALAAVASSAGSFLFLASVLTTDLPALPTLGAYSMAWLVGYLAVPFPTGIGVREVVLAILLAQWMPPENVVAVALVHRVLQAAVEGVLSFASRWWRSSRLGDS